MSLETKVEVFQHHHQPAYGIKYLLLTAVGG